MMPKEIDVRATVFTDGKPTHILDTSAQSYEEACKTVSAFMRNTVEAIHINLYKRTEE